MKKELKFNDSGLLEAIEKVTLDYLKKFSKYEIKVKLIIRKPKGRIAEVTYLVVDECKK